jgi:DNA-binding Lrp family transcriptional regulator
MPPTSPEFQKLLHSTQSQIPLDLDFWGRLAYGLRMEPAALGAMVADLTSEGVLLGFCGELNVAMVEAGELLTSAPAPEGTLVRWEGASAEGSMRSLGWLVAPPAIEGWPSVRVTKLGGRLRPGLVSGIDLLAPESDRTTRVIDGPPAHLNFASESEALIARALLSPTQLVYPQSPWEVLAAAGGTTPEGAMRDVRALLMNRILRRVSLRFSARALGFEGIVLAGWAMPDESQATAAAEGLSAIEGTADVFVRVPHLDSRVNLTALFQGFARGSGADAASRIGNQWGIPPVMVTEIEPT